MSSRQVGSHYETLAIKYLEDNGLTITQRNYRCKLGEIDLIGEDREYLVFIEVKYRTTSNIGYSVEAVNYKKQRIISKCASYYCMVNDIDQMKSIRFDVVIFDGNEFEWIKNAFEYIEK